MRKFGFRFGRNDYVLTDMENMTVTEDREGEVVEYTIGGDGGTGEFELDLRTFPNTMSAGMTAQIVYTCTDGAEMRFHSNASVSKISVDINGLLTCIGNSTGACIITMTAVNSKGDTMGTIKKRIDVV